MGGGFWGGNLVWGVWVMGLVARGMDSAPKSEVGKAEDTDDDVLMSMSERKGIDVDIDVDVDIFGRSR